MDLALFTGGSPGILEIFIILFMVLLLFGSKKLPELARALGKSLSEFKKGKEEALKSSEVESSDNKKTIAGKK